MASAEELSTLMNLHLGDLREENPSWIIAESPVAGRGLFATRNIQAGEVIFQERPLIVGPTARKGSPLNLCVCCQKLLATEDFLCKYQCTLPVCDDCVDSERHREECMLFRQWLPKEFNPCNGNAEPSQDSLPSPNSIVNPFSLRILTAVRVFFLNPEQRQLVCAMQANPDRSYRREIIKAADCFRNFPTTDKAFMDNLFRVVGVLNTNAFEASRHISPEQPEVLLRALFPLTAVMNHECTPNASHYFDDGRLAIVRASRPIPKGGEITTTYTKILWNNLTRSIFLKMTKHFVCNCPRCDDSTENGTNLSALFCRQGGCKGLVIPMQTKTVQPDWRCLTCESTFPHTKMSKYQDFALNTINNRINSCSVKEMIKFITEMCPRFCPASNYILIEAKLNVIWRMSRFKNEDYTEAEFEHRDQFRRDILDVLQKLGAGECTLKKLITEEIQ